MGIINAERQTAAHKISAMKKSKVSFTFTHPSLKIDYHVEGFIHHGAPGQRVGSARFQEPDEPDEWEFISATMVIGGKVFTESDFSEDELELIENEAFENAEPVELSDC